MQLPAHSRVSENLEKLSKRQRLLGPRGRADRDGRLRKAKARVMPGLSPRR